MRDTVNVVIGVVGVLFLLAVFARILTPTEFHHRPKKPHPYRRAGDKRPSVSSN